MVETLTWINFDRVVIKGSDCQLRAGMRNGTNGLQHALAKNSARADACVAHA